MACSSEIGPSLSATTRLGLSGSIVLLRTDSVPKSPILSGFNIRHAREYLDSSWAEDVEQQIAQWVKALGTVALGEGNCFDSLFSLGGFPLWSYVDFWMYEHLEAPNAREVLRLYETVNRILVEEKPDIVLVGEEGTTIDTIVQDVATARGVEVRCIKLGYHRMTPDITVHLRTMLLNRLRRMKETFRHAFATVPGLGHSPQPGQVVLLSYTRYWNVVSGQWSDMLLSQIIATLKSTGLGTALVDRDLTFGPGIRFLLLGRHHTTPLERYQSRLSSEDICAIRDMQAKWNRVRERVLAIRYKAWSPMEVLIRKLDYLFGVKIWEVFRTCRSLLTMLADISPRLVILSGEASLFGRLAVAACRQAGVPSLAIQHGIIYDHHFGYSHRLAPERPYPLADMTCVFSDCYRNILIRNGYQADAVAVVGDPRYPSQLPPLRNSSNGRVVVVLTQPIAEAHVLVDHVCELLAREAGIYLVIKMHPVEQTITSYRKYRRSLKRHQLHGKIMRVGDLADLFRMAHVVVTVSSTGGLEARQLFNRPVIAYSPTPNVNPLEKLDSSIVVVRDKLSLARALRAVLDAPFLTEEPFAGELGFQPHRFVQAVGKIVRV